MARFLPGFGRVSHREREQADRFFEDLTGVPAARRPRGRLVESAEDNPGAPWTAAQLPSPSGSPAPLRESSEAPTKRPGSSVESSSTVDCKGPLQEVGRVR